MSSPQDANKTRQPIDTENAVMFPDSDDAPESDKHVHGLYPEDLKEGIRCAACWLYARTQEEYEAVVLEVHGVIPKR